MIQFVNGQNDFSEETLDGIYRGLRQGAYWEQKAKEYEKSLTLFDSLTSGMSKRLEIASKKEDNYLRIIENQNRNFEAQKKVGKFEVKQAKRGKNKWIVIAGIAGMATGAYLAK